MTIDSLMTDWYSRTGAVGAVAGLVTGEGITWSGGIGFADLQRQEPMDPERSIMKVASISKLITATAVMQLVEAGCIDLDAAIDSYLSFEVKHPTYPHEAVTARRLLTHTSAIAEGPAYWDSNAPGDPKINLGEWLNRYFDPAGTLSPPGESWHLGTSPGERHAYSNVGFGLLGHLVEAVSGINFRHSFRGLVGTKYRRPSIPQPGGMMAATQESEHNLSWILS